MPFRITARVITQLGAELISSDAVALFELVKNGFDAGSSVVTIRITYAIDHALISLLEERFVALKGKSDQLSTRAISILREEEERSRRESGDLLIYPDAVESLAERLSNCTTIAEILRQLRATNSIEIADVGTGMDFREVDEYFLTVGTTHRRDQHEAHINEGTPYPTGYPVAGEKGIGRLSAMRLGKFLILDTWTAHAAVQTRLIVDWRWFYENPSADPDTFNVRPRRVARKRGADESGTRLMISDLNEGWPVEKVKPLASQHLAKFIDPFAKGPRSVELYWNKQTVDLAALLHSYLRVAHNGMKGELSIDEEGAFTIAVRFWFTLKSKERIEVSRRYTESDFGGITNEAIERVGPFTFELYHYNRPRIESVPGVATRDEVRNWLDEWCGGLMVYRDGLRVLPYGKHPEDDWLELDQKALRGKGFRINRIQTVGCVHISRATNPNLVDQTNREGFQDNPASESFRDLVKRLVADCFVPLYREKVEASASVDPHQLAQEASESEEEVTAAAKRLIDAIDDDNRRGIAAARSELMAAVKRVSELAVAIENSAATHQLQRLEVTELAAKGLAAESMAHDVEAVLDSSITEAGLIIREKQLSERLKGSLQHLVAILKSARVQIAGIKPGPAKRRRRRSILNLNAIVAEVAGVFAPRFARHEIDWRFSVRPRQEEVNVYMVEGHLRQILENIIRNSIYWTLDEREKRKGNESWIDCQLNTRLGTLTIRDSGPGFAPEETGWVFVPFNSHRPEGRGLGLSIARDLCAFNEVEISIDERHENAKGRFSGIVLDFSKCIRQQ